MSSNPEEEEESNPLLGPTTKPHPKNPQPQPQPQPQPDPNLNVVPPPQPQEKQLPVESESPQDVADGLPLGLLSHHIPVNMSPHCRAQWSSGLCSCLSPNEHFCSTDLEVCLLGTIAPCVLYGSNVERLGAAPGTFTNHCMTYTALYLIGNSFFGWNCLAPWFSYTNRTALRRRFNLEGGFEGVARQYGCCGRCVEDEAQREQCETACDFGTHVFCHPCSLCQEAREIRRRLPHPAFNTHQPPPLFMIPPPHQAMPPHQL